MGCLKVEGESLTWYGESRIDTNKIREIQGRKLVEIKAVIQRSGERRTYPEFVLSLEDFTGVAGSMSSVFSDARRMLSKWEYLFLVFRFCFSSSNLSLRIL